MQLFTILVSVFAATALFQPLQVHGQGGGADSGQGFTNRDRQGPGNVGGVTYENITPSVGGGGGGGGGADSGQAAAAAQPPDTSNIDLGSGIYNMLFMFVVTVFGTLFSWSSALFDVGLNTFVLGFGDLYYNKNVGVSVEEVWKIIRDLFNLTFIFGLVMIGFKMILDSNDSKARSTLVSLIGAALLVNFSLFITKFVIDIANVTASVVSKGFGVDGDGQVVSIANGFVNLLKLTTALNIHSEQIVALQNGAAFGYIFGLLIFFAVAAFVFAAGGIMMIIRFIVLCAYMVFSPVMFIGWVFPSLSKHSSKYWSGFLGQAFFAPAYLLMLYLSFKVMISYRDQIGVVDYGGLFAAGPDVAGSAVRVIPFFIMTMVFLVLSLVVAKNMGAVGASTAISIGNKMVGGARQRLTSAATYIPRATSRVAVNAGGEYAGKKLNSLQARGGAIGWVASRNSVDRTVRGAADSAAKAKFGTSGSNKDQREYRAGTQAKINQTQDEQARAAAMATSDAALQDVSTSATGLTDAMKKLGEAVKKMSVDEKAKLGFSSLNDQNVALHLTDEELDGMKKSGKLSNEQVTSIKATRTAAQTSIAVNGSTLSGRTANPNISNAGFMHSQREALMNRSVQDAGKMPVGLFKESEMAPYITPQMLQERMKNGGITNSDLAKIRTNLNAHVNNNNLPNHPQIRKMWENWSNTTTYGAQLGLTII